MKKLFISLLAFFCIATAFAQTALTPEILWSMRRISGGTVSPDGTMVLYGQRTFNMDENKGNTDLFILDVKTGVSRQVTNTPGSEMEAQWGKNNIVWFMSNGDDGLQIRKINADGTNIRTVSRFKSIELEGFRLSPDETYAMTIEAIEIRGDVTAKYSDLPKANARIEDDLMYRHWDHYDDYKRRHLFLHQIMAENGLPVIYQKAIDIQRDEVFDGVLPPFGGTDQFCFSADSKKIIYTSKKLQGKAFATSTNSDLYEYTISTQTTINLTESNKGYDNNPAYSPQGDLAWLSMSRNGFEADKNNLMLRKADGTVVNLTADMDITVGSFCWHPSGKMIYFIAPTKGTEHIFEVELATKKIRQVTTGQYDYISISIFGDVIFAGRQSMVAPTDLYAVSIKSKDKVTQLTKSNADILSTIVMPKVQEKWIETTDGKQMLVWMVLPPNFDPTKKYPTLLYCQGGPQSQVSQFFSYRWNLALMASQGYVVVAPNRRGLPGFGQEWNDAISKDWGGQAMRDYLSAIDAATKESYVDKERLGAVGASYGGYSVYMLAGIHQNRFKTFVSHCGLFNLESWYGTTEELFFANWDHGGPYWLPENKANYEKNSPHNYVANWNTPILVIHGGMDFRVPESEGIQAFQAAQLKGIKSRYLSFPTEGHWVQSPQNGLLWQREFFEWLAEDLHP
jgi:dipeptidyl aminopeptidase/acylaminoacyl peptidase